MANRSSKSFASHFFGISASPCLSLASDAHKPLFLVFLFLTLRLFSVVFFVFSDWLAV